MGKTEKRGESWQERRKKSKHKWAVPFIFIEWNCERLSDLLKRWAFLEILEHLGRLAIVVAIVFYFIETGSRRKAKHYQAWQVINSAQGKPGSGGRMDALQDLCADRISLAGVDISKANLPKLNLAGADLFGANLAEAVLVGANLAGAHLSDANLAHATLWHANLAEADLCRSILSGIWGWEGIGSIELANIYGVYNPPERFEWLKEPGFIAWAKEHGAVSIAGYSEWGKFIRDKRKQEADNSTGVQKNVP